MSAMSLGDNPTSVLAVASTIHVAALLLRAHRNPNGRKYDLLLLPTIAFVGMPWAFPTTIGLAVGLALHLAWFTACEHLVPAIPVPAPITASAQRAPRALTPAPAPALRPAPPPACPSPPRPASGFVKTSVIGVFPETPDITTFRLMRPEGFEFSAGQFVTVRVSVDGKPVARCYSISSAPETTGYLEISVKRQGLVSGLLHASMRPGSTLEVRKPAGVFTYPAGDERPVALVAGGVGVTPLMSMLRHSLQADPTRPVTMLYSVSTHRDVVFRDELRWLTNRHPHAKVVVTTTKGPHDAEYYSGRIDRRFIAEHVPELVNTVFLICGPAPMIEAVRAGLVELGVPDSQIRFEAFEAAVASAAIPEPAAAPQPTPAPIASGSGGLLTPTPAPFSDPPLRSGFQLRLVSSGQSLTVGSDQTLLEICEENGVAVNSVCRAGVCGACRTRVVEGQVRCDSKRLSETDRAAGYVYPCVSHVTGDCAVEL